jgi:hypothetical protein
VAQLESLSRAAHALGMPGHAMLGFKIDQQRGTFLTMAALIPSVKFNGTITPREVRKQPNMLLVTRSLLDLWTPRAVHPLDQLFKMKRSEALLRVTANTRRPAIARNPPSMIRPDWKLPV